MGDYILEIAEESRYISVSRGHVIIKEGKNKLGEIAIDSLAFVILSANEIVLSKNFLARMGEENIPVIICGKNYMPVSMALPMSSHSRHLTIAEIQVTASSVIKKQLWQSIIIVKIKNQAEILKKHKPNSHKEIDKLYFLADRVRSGDSDNKEGQAARIYWQALFGKEFYRDVDQAGVNTFLNYAYAILRAVVARALCASGLLPLFGIHHHNAYNAFCLADDIMEPFRPFVDDIVYALHLENACDELDTDAKRKLGQILRCTMYLNTEESTLIPIALKVAQALVRSYKNKTVSLQYPSIF